ncbi:hypothetical protein [Methanolobus sp. ZRKC5]|uniref:hypothetical protein n=1 Tax=unclassified Methanolobus TaxID=2629569 RepID=UPI00313B3794
MSGFELTQQEMINWKRFQKITKRKPAEPLKNIPVKRREEAVDLYLESKSLGHVCSQLKMARGTLTKILDLYEVVY